MVYATILKTGAFLTALSSIAVIAVSSWTLSTTFSRSTETNSSEIPNIALNASDNSDNNFDEKYQKFMDFANESSTINPPTKSSMENFWENKPPRYKTLIQAFSGVSTTAGLIQLTLSWMVICGNMKNIRERVKLWQLANFVIFLILLICISVPLTFSAKKDAFLGSRTFWTRFFNKIKNNGYQYIQNLDYNVFTKSLDGYFITLIVNDVILFAILNFACCCLCYSCNGNAYHNA